MSDSDSGQSTAEPGVTIDVRTRDGVSIIVIDGFVDHSNVRILEDIVRNLVNQGEVRLLINCTGMNFISSEGMGIFLSYLIKVRKAGGDIKFCGMGEDIEGIVSILGLKNLLKMFETEDEGVLEFKNEAPSDDIAEKKTSGLGINQEVTESGIAILHMRGYIDHHTIADLEAALKDTLAEGQANIVLDFAGLNYISSTGMGILLNYLKNAREENGDVRMAALQESVETLVTMLGLNNLFQIFKTADEAVASFS